MATERLPMRKIREFLRMRWHLGLSVREVSRGLGISVGVVQKIAARAKTAGLRLGAGGRPRRARVGRAPLRAASRAGRPTTSARPRVHASRGSAAGGDPRAPSPRVPRGTSRRTALHRLLRHLPALAFDGRARDAAGPQGRREDVCRLLGKEALLRRPVDGRGHRGRVLRRRPRREQLHVRGGDGDAEGCRLRRLPCPRLRVLRRRHGDHRPRSTQVGRHDG